MITEFNILDIEGNITLYSKSPNLSHLIISTAIRFGEFWPKTKHWFKKLCKWKSTNKMTRWVILMSNNHGGFFKKNDLFEKRKDNDLSFTLSLKTWNSELRQDQMEMNYWLMLKRWTAVSNSFITY